MIDVACQCGKSFKVKDDLAGKRGRCPVCGATMVVPVAMKSPQLPVKPAAVRTSNAVIFSWFLAASMFGFGCLMALLALVNFEARKQFQSTSNSQAVLIRELSDRNDALKADLVLKAVAAREVVDVQKIDNAAGDAERERQRLLDEGFGREPSTPAEFAEQRRLAIGVEKTFHNETREPGTLIDITGVLILPGDGNWLFRTTNDSSRNVVAVERGAVRETPANESVYVWAAYGAKAAANWFAVEWSHGDPVDVKSVEVESVGAMKAFVRNKSTGTLYLFTIKDFDLKSYDEVDE